MNEVFNVTWISANNHCINFEHDIGDLTGLIRSFEVNDTPVNALITEKTSKRTGTISFNSGESSLLSQIDRLNIGEQIIICPIPGSVETYIIRRTA